MENIDDIQDAINEMELNQQPINEIAHYTSLEALNSIIDGIRIIEASEPYLTLRATCALETDDSEELQEGSEFLMEILTHLEEGKLDKYKLTNYMMDVKSSDRCKYLSEKDLISWFYGGKRTPYIISFSRYIDKLFMWQMSYAKNGEGVCLVFDFSTMNYSNDQLVIRSPFPILYGGRLGYVNYKKGFLFMIWEEYNKYCNKVNNISDPDEITSLKLQSLEVLYAFVSSYFKKEEWHYQQEVRIMCTTEDEQSPCILIDEKDRKYVEVPIPFSCLNKIVLGPKVPNTDVNDIKSRLLQYGFKADDVVKSNQPLR